MSLRAEHADVVRPASSEPAPAVAVELVTAPAPTATLTLGARARAYLALSKPRIIPLLLITTVPTMVVAAGGLPGAGLVLATLVGGGLAAAGANSLNCVLERDLDVRMHRTRNRPMVRATLSHAEGMTFGLGIGAVGVLWLAATVNVLAALLTASAIAFYVLVYTMGLKRRTHHNIVIGGAAGCVPVLVGWAAVTGEVGLPAILLFALVFVWTPPHFWALAMRMRDDYRAADVPMLPVVRGMEHTSRQVFAYTWVVVAVSLAFAPVAGMGAIYWVVATLLGAHFVHAAWRLLRTPDGPTAMVVFRASISYLAVLFAAMAADVLLLG